MPNPKPIEIDGILYENGAAAAEALGITITAAYKRANARHHEYNREYMARRYKETHIPSDRPPNDRDQASGEDHGHARLTWAKVREIRTRYPDETLAELAAAYGVSTTTISDIVNHRTWKE